jgi:predicted secreted Zn-dependent protease
MLNVIAILAAAAAVQGATPVQTRTLQNLPGVKLHPYAVSGTNKDTIQRSLEAAIKSQPKTAGQLFTWTASIKATQETVGGVCKINSASAALDANVYLPQLADQTKMPAADLAQWNAYEASISQDATDNLWFVAERLPAIGQSLVGKPCNQAATVWNSAITQLISQQQAFDKQLGKKKRGTSNPYDRPSNRDYSAGDMRR